MYQKITYYSRISQTLHVPVPAAASAGYTGPGDKVSGATAWYGLRAYSSAQCTGSVPAIQVNSNEGDTDILITTGGDLDSATLGGLTGTVLLKKIYDQIGTNHLILRAGTGVGALLSQGPAGLGGTRWVWDNTVNNADYLSGSTVALTQPFATSAVLKANTSAAFQSYFGTGTTANIMLSWQAGGANLFSCTADGGAHSASVSATDNAFHSHIANFNAPNDQSFADGSGGATSNSPGNVTETIDWGSSPTFSQMFSLYCEFGIWLSTTFTGQQVTDLYDNQHTYWGF